MKHITITLIFISVLFNLTNESKSKQLFDMLDKEFRNNSNSAGKNSASNSIFSPDNNPDNEISFAQKNEKSNGSNSLFDDSDIKPIENGNLNNSSLKPKEKSLFEDYNDSEAESNKFLNNQNKKNEKSLFGNKDENTENNNDSIFGDVNKNDIKTGDSKSLFDADEETVKPQVQLNENIQPLINKLHSNNKKDTSNRDNNNSLNKETNKLIHNKHNDELNNNKIDNSNYHNNNNRIPKNTKSGDSHNKRKQKENVITESTLSESKSEIDKLKTKVLNLIHMNGELMKELDKKRKYKQKSVELSDDLINLIETNQTPLVEFEEKLKTTKENSESKLEKKQKELNMVYSDVRENLDKLVDKVETTRRLLDEFNEDEKLSNGELKKNFSTDSLSVLNNVEVEGQTIANMINSESIDIGNIKIDLEKISIINPHYEIVVGSEVLSVKELIENMEILENLKKRCGENLENCVLNNEQNFKSDIERQNDIIEELTILRKKIKN